MPGFKKNFTLLASLFFVASIFTSCSIFRRAPEIPYTFTNPLLTSGADPWNIYRDGYYYYTQTIGDRLEIWKTKNLAQLGSAPHKTIWIPPPGTMYSKQLWAPELHFID